MKITIGVVMNRLVGMGLKDPVSAQVVQVLEKGWPDTVKSKGLLP